MKRVDAQLARVLDNLATAHTKPPAEVEGALRDLMMQIIHGGKLMRDDIARMPCLQEAKGMHHTWRKADFLADPYLVQHPCVIVFLVPSMLLELGLAHHHAAGLLFDLINFYPVCSPLVHSPYAFTPEAIGPISVVDGLQV
eukprot:1157732-Pelagomonas_calceolata.AAC.6